MGSKNSKILTVVSGLLFLLVTNPVFSAENVSVFTLRLKWFHQFQFAGYYAADKNGYYQDEGLEIEILEGGYGISPVNEVINGETDFGVMNSGIIIEYAEGKPIVVLSAIFQHSPYVLYTLKSKGIYSPQDLAGKKVMLTGNYLDAPIRTMLLREGVPLESVEFIPHNYNYNELIDGKVDAMAGYITELPAPLDAYADDINLIRAIDYGIDFYGDVLFTSEHIASRHPEKVEAFRRATHQGWEYALYHEQEIIEYILTLDTTRPHLLTKEMLDYEANKMDKLIVPDYIPIGHINEDRWQRIAEIFKESGYIKTIPDINKFIFNAEMRNITVLFKIIASVFTIICILIVVILSVQIVFNRRLKREINRRMDELRESEEWFNQLGILFPNGSLFRMAWNGGRRFRFERQSDGLWKKMNIPGDVCRTPHKLFKCVEKEDRKEIMKGLKKSIEEGSEVNVEYRLTFNDRQYWIQGYAIPVKMGKDTIVWDGYQLDISEMKKIRDVMLQTDKFKTIAGMSAGISHEINNPLGIILQSIQNVKRRTSAETVKNREEAKLAGISLEGLDNYFKSRNIWDYLHGIEQAAVRASRIVKNMLLFSRTGFGEKEEVNIHELIEKVTDFIKNDFDLSSRFDMRAIPIEIDFRAEKHVVSCNAIEIEQVFLNIIKNGAHAVTESDFMKETPRIIIRTDNREEMLYISISNNGPPIPENIMEHIFEPFSTTKSSGQGTGLGLFIARHIITVRNKGTIDVDSGEGRDTVFKIGLPL